jgi:hypothetical protein
MSEREPAPGTLIRTFTDPVSEYRCVAVVMPPTLTYGWTIRVDGTVVGADGLNAEMTPAEPHEIPAEFPFCPSITELYIEIDRFLGNTRRTSLTETTAVTMQVLDLLAFGVGTVGALVHDPQLGVIDALPHASHIARTLVLGDSPDSSVYASVLVGLACGMHPDPPGSWAMTPVGQIASREGLLEHVPFDEPLSESAAALLLGEPTTDAIVRLVNLGMLDAHPVSGVTRASVDALLAARIDVPDRKFHDEL